MDTCKDNIDASNLNYGQIFFMMLGFLPVLFSFPCWIIAKYIFKPMMLEYESRFDELVELLHVPPLYEEKYPVKDISGNDVTKLHNIVVEDTPQGNVAMRYNKDTEAFEYWSDKNINYKYLETVSRKYVNVFNCGSLYINRMKLLEEKVGKIKKEIDENLKKKEEDKNESKNDENSKKDNDDVFANLKNYKKGTTDNIKTKLTKDDVVCDTANKYIRKGKFNENNEWLKSNKSDDAQKTTSSSNGMMGWLEWKNRSKKD